MATAANSTSGFLEEAGVPFILRAIIYAASIACSEAPEARRAFIIRVMKGLSRSNMAERASLAFLVATSAECSAAMMVRPLMASACNAGSLRLALAGLYAAPYPVTDGMSVSRLSTFLVWPDAEVFAIVFSYWWVMLKMSVFQISLLFMKNGSEQDHCFQQYINTGKRSGYDYLGLSSQAL